MNTVKNIGFFCISIAALLMTATAAETKDTDLVPVMAAICDATNAPITTKGLGKLCKVANELPSDEEEVRQEIFKMACAGLLAIGDETNFEKLYARITDKDSGCEYVSECPRCEGKGYAEKICPVCGGGGHCRICYGQGETRRRGLAGAADVVMPCGKCGRSGKCDRCKGKGKVTDKCSECLGKGKFLSRDGAKRTFRRIVASLTNSLEEREMAAKGLYRYDGEWVTAEERDHRREREQKAREEREAKQREIARRMRELGLEYIDGEWMTPGSLRRIRYRIFQIYEPGHALCEFIGTDIIFCLLYSAKDNPNLAEGDRLVNDLYRCGTYSYTTVRGAPSTVRMYAIDLEVALKEIKRQR